MLPGILALVALPVIPAGYLFAGLWARGVWIVKQIKQVTDRRRNRIEAELDRKQADLPSTICQLASELGDNAHEARKAVIRASFEASPRRNDSSQR